MLRRLVTTAALATALAAAPAAHAQLPAGSFASDNVEFLKNLATGPSSGAKLLDGFFYHTTGNTLTIFDTRPDPENPVEVGSVMLSSPGAGEQRAPEEDPDTNGRILITTNGGKLQVYDVIEKTSPSLLAELDGITQHTISCVLDCTWAYGSDGAVIDLRDPSNPKEAGDWQENLDISQSHDVTEISPGLVMVSGQPLHFLDVRADPAKPKVIATGTPPGFVHANLWPRMGADDFLLTGGEASGPECSDNASATFASWDTRGWRTKKTYSIIDQFKMATGLPPNGAMPATTFCVHWFETQPQFHNGGLVAIGWYEHGARFLSVGPDGKLAEVGWYLPYGARTSGVYWVSDRVAYTADYYRGLDVIKFTGDIPPGRPDPAAPGQPPAAAPPGSSSQPPAQPKPASRRSFDEMVKLPSNRRCVRSLSLRVKRFAEDPVTQVVVRVNGKKRLNATGRKLRKPLKVTRLPRKSFTVQVLVRTRSGHKTAAQRAYARCR